MRNKAMVGFHYLFAMENEVWAMVFYGGEGESYGRKV